MEEGFKARIILILGILSAIFFIGTIGSCANAGRMRSLRDKEMATRLDLEERGTKCAQEKVSLEQRLKKLEEALSDEQAAHQATKKALVQEQLVSSSFKEELGKVTKLKETLEEDLKEALVANKKLKR